MESVAERMKKLRERTGMSQQAVADHLGLTRPGYAQIENGKNGKKFSMLPKIAKTLGCRIDDLFPEMDEAPTNAESKTVSADGFVGAQNDDDDSLDCLVM